MLQRFDISIDRKENILAIEEFAALGRVTKKNHKDIDPAEEIFSLLYKETYDCHTIQKAIKSGKPALISEIRGRAFFPIYSCVNMIADKVIELFDNKTASFSELFFDDQGLSPKADHTEKPVDVTIG